jgi:malate/lactate dehydrogenase
MPDVTTAAVLGAGALGGAVAQALAAREAVDRVLLIDPNGSAAAGKALDLLQACAITGTHSRLQGSSDAARAAGCDVVVVADAFGSSDEAPHGAHLAALGNINRTAPVVFAGATHAPLLRTMASDSDTGSTRAMGSSPEALISAVRAIVALEARCAPAELTLAVLGVPPDGFVVPWSDATIRGGSLHAILSPGQIARLDARIARLWPLDAYALGAAAAVVVEGALRSARRAFNVLAWLEGEYGMRSGIGTVQAWLSPAGIVRRTIPALSARERTLLESALQRPLGLHG